jgi:hypothetical protein
VSEGLFRVNDAKPIEPEKSTPVDVKRISQLKRY